MLAPPIPIDEKERLITLRARGVLDTPPEERFDRITRTAKCLFGVPIAVITLIDTDRQWFKSCQGLEISETPRSISFCGHAICDDQLLVVSDATQDARFADNPLVVGEAHIRFYAGQPIKATNGSRLGTLCVIDTKPRHPSQTQLDALCDLAAMVESELNSLDIKDTQKLQLRNSEAVLSATVNGALDAVVRIDDQGVINFWNAQSEKIFGWSQNEAVGRLIHKTILPPRYQDAHIRGMKHFLASGEGSNLNRQVEVVALHRDGYEFPISLSITPLKVNGTYQFSAFIRDITEARQAEADLRIAATAFESQESLMITDANGVVLRVNQAFTKTTGYTSEDVVGENSNMLHSERHDAVFYQEMWDAVSSKGGWQGEAWGQRKNGETYLKWLIITAVKGADGSVSHYVWSHMDVSERKAAEEKIHRLAFYDSLTEIPNRRLLSDRLQQAMAASGRSGKGCALLFLDLDHFKVLNDTLGHEVGDLLLQQVAKRLASCIREGDTVARLGGDEFVVLLEMLGQDAVDMAAQTETIVEKIFSALQLPYQLGLHEHRSSVSIGAVLFSGQQSSVDDLLKQADIAMYQAKKAGRNTMRFFDLAMQAAVNARADMELELYQAVKEQQFQLYYQIQVNDSNRPVGAETLLRWVHPERGFIAPDKFIPLAEETNLILPIGAWVLDTACAQLKKWQQNECTQDLTIAVNVSAKQLREIGFLEQVQTAVQRHDIDPKLLKLELTESMLVEDFDHIVAVMKALRELDIQFSMDDFGTGYSSLQYLKVLPLNQLKIDRSFVKDMVFGEADHSIVKTIIAMANALGLNVIAEGVETEEQRRLLARCGCYHYQGYLFSKPLPIEEFDVLVKRI